MIQAAIALKLNDALTPDHLEVINESRNHSVPEGSESHFKVVIASPQFLGKSLVQRHRMVYQILDHELKNGVHALALHTYTPEEWTQSQAPKSPPCLGGSQHDHE